MSYEHSKNQVLETVGKLEDIVSNFSDYFSASELEIARLKQQVSNKIDLIEERDAVILELRKVNNWFRGFPKETGLYWFYGWCSEHTKKRNPEKPELFYVKVKTNNRNNWFYITEGRFLYESECDGVWQKATTPYVYSELLSPIA